MKRFVAVLVAVSLLFILSGCIVQTYKGSNGDYSIELPKEFTKDRQANDDKLKITTTTFKTKDGAELDISESTDPKFVLNKDSFAAELEMDTLFKVMGIYSVESKAGTVYVARIVDGVTSLNMLYGIAKINDKVVTFIRYQSPVFSQEQETQFKDMLKTLKKLK